MLTMLYELFCRILSKTQQFLALMKTLRKILIFFPVKLVSKRLKFHMCVLVRPFIRRTLIVAGNKIKDRFPLKAQFLDFSGFDEDRRIFQSFILDARYANDSQVCTTIAGKTFLPIKSFSCGHEFWCECSSKCSNEEVVTIKCLQFVFYQLAAIFVIDPTLDKTQRWSSILRRVFPCGQRFSWVFLRKKLKIQRFLILSKKLG